MSFSSQAKFNNKDLMRSIEEKAKRLSDQRKRKFLRETTSQQTQQITSQRLASPMRKYTITKEESTLCYSQESNYTYSYQPQIDKKSRDLVEQSFKRLMSPKLSGSEIPVQLRIRNQSIQTEETCHDYLKRDTTFKKIRSKQSSPSTRTRQQTSTLQPSEPSEFERYDTQTQTDFERNYKTPKKPISTRERAASGDKGSSTYVPIQQRTELILQLKQEKIDKLKKSIEATSPRQSQGKRMKTLDDLDDGEDRYQSFFESQNRWLDRKKNNMAQKKLLQADLDYLENQKRGTQTQRSKKCSHAEIVNMNFDKRQKQLLMRKQSSHNKTVMEISKNLTFSPKLTPYSMTLLRQKERFQY